MNRDLRLAAGTAVLAQIGPIGNAGGEIGEAWNVLWIVLGIVIGLIEVVAGKYIEDK